MWEAAISWRSCVLVVTLVLLCITTTNCQIPEDGSITPDNAETNGETTLLDQCGPSGNVITTLFEKEPLKIICKKMDAVIVDDPWWLNVRVPGFNNRIGWVTDYYAFCGHTGFCNAPLCPV